MSQATRTVRVVATQTWPLHDSATTRQIEHHAQAALPPHALMQRAGWAVAQWALAIAPHSQRIWIACGPGNNGGDGMEAALHLHAWGKQVHLTWHGHPERSPEDSRQAHARLLNAGLTIQAAPPTEWDLAIDALLGLGCARQPDPAIAHELARMHAHTAPVLQVDLPSGLVADTGMWQREAMPLNAPRHTLALLTLKPGMFTAEGRDACGDVWFNALGVNPPPEPTAWLQKAQPTAMARPHHSHKGSYGEVRVVGGDTCMTGAALLAGHAALRGGAGRVHVSLLDAQAGELAAASHPTLMFDHHRPLALGRAVAVCGCGGGEAVRHVMAAILSEAASMVIDADGLNALRDPMLMQLLIQRHARGRQTVLTPHPLEAARLLACDVAEVQAHRLAAAQKLADQTRAVVVLKGSGTVVAATGKIPTINASGNARLASAGTGDVLAGLTGAYLAQGANAWEAACFACAHHGWVADQWPAGESFDAWRMTERL